MNIIQEIFGEGKDLNVLQMSCRSVVVFLIAYLLLRISGRRSFGLRTPLDNIITITLGAVLSRAIVGASPFVPIVVASLVIVLLHRAFAWLTTRSKAFAGFAEGDKILLYSNGKFDRHHMKRALVREEDIMRGVRRAALTDDLEKIDRIYMEQNGEISVVKKEA